DGELAALVAAVPGLRELELVRPRSLTDAGLAALTALSALTQLTVAGAQQLTVAGFTPAARCLRQLRLLVLRDLPSLTAAHCDQLEGSCPRRGQLRVQLVGQQQHAQQA
ncbi:hypothetical protein Agub_g8396, partial [Astrephomene gubernaculifera]